MLIPVFVYLGLFALAWLTPDKLIFQPQPSSYRDGPGILKLDTASGEKIAARHYLNPSAEFTILFSHGNAEDIGDLEPLFHELQNAGFSVFAYDYRGYGRSEGVPTEENSYRDIDAAYKYLTGQLNIAPEKIILHGRSLGGGPSTDLAARSPVGGLILESAFTSAFRVVTWIELLPFDKFQNIDKLPGVKCPVLVIHGKKDNVIAFRHGEQLYSAAPGRKYAFWVDEAGHNDLFFVAREGYIDAIREFTKNL